MMVNSSIGAQTSTDDVTPRDLFTYFREEAWHGAGLGRILPDLTVRDDDGRVHDLYQCKACAALTASPTGHVAWHMSLASPTESGTP